MLHHSSIGKPLAGLVALAATAWTAAAAAQGYPNKSITLIIPFAAGGPSDTLGRLTADHLGRTLGQQIIVENVGGAGGTTGTDRAAKAAADGYTLFQHHNGLVASAVLYANLKYDTKTAFETIGLINTGPMVLTSKKTLETKNAKELFDWLKKNSDKATIAHAGVGSNSYLCTMLLIQLLGTKPAMVAYRGTGPAMNDLVGGQVDVLCDQATTATPQVLAGTIKGYAVTSPERLAALPNVPSSKEAGLTGFDMVIWNALYAPKGTPKEVLDKVHAALQKFVDDPKIQERFAQTGTVAFAKDRRSPEEHRRFMLAELDRYAAMVKATGLKPEEAK